jgi:type I restriction enzyme S subunit
MKWRTMPLKAIKAPVPYAFVGGPFGSNLTTRDYIQEGIPVIRGNNLTVDSLFREEDFVFVSEKKATDLRPNTAYPGDLIFTQRGTLGQVGLIPREARYQRYIISQSQMKLTVNPEIAYVHFVYYLFRQPSMVQKVINYAITSGVPHINLGILKEFKIRLPEIDSQKRAADILSAYDDLIDINRRRIQLLEETARHLYREWFIYFRFPGHGKVEIIDGVPEGWVKVLLADIAIVKKGRNITFEQAIEGDIPVVGGGLEPTYYHNKANVSAPVITISASGANAGYVNMYDTDIWASDCSYIDKNSTKYIYSLYLRLKSLQTTIFGFQVGAAQPHVYPRDLNKLRLLKASDDLCIQFEQLITPIFNLIKNLKIQNQKLAQARDLLLPRLMSGAIEV